MTAVGSSVARKDGIGKATGAALYADDIVFPGMLFGRTIRSTIPRGRVKSIRLDFDTTGFTIVDYRDVPGKNAVALITEDQPFLVEGEVRRARHHQRGGYRVRFRIRRRAHAILSAVDRQRRRCG